VEHKEKVLFYNFIIAFFPLIFSLYIWYKVTKCLLISIYLIIWLRKIRNLDLLLLINFTVAFFSHKLYICLQIVYQIICTYCMGISFFNSHNDFSFFFHVFHVKLLNEKNDDEDEETRAGVKKRNELLQQLMKDQDEERKLQEQQVCFILVARNQST